VRMVDAAREAARAAARGDAEAEAEARGERIAPGSTVTVVNRDDEVISTATGSVDPPGGLVGFLPAVRLHARAVAVTEEP